MNTILKILLTAIAVVIIAYLLPGVEVVNYVDAIVVAIVLGLLRITVKPILVLFTLPITVVTLGLFLLVINALIILLADYFVSGFNVSGFWVALLFSILLTVFQSILYSFIKEK
jgi:putative membrane protein